MPQLDRLHLDLSSRTSVDSILVPTPTVEPREQDLPGHVERLQRARALIGRRKWNDFDGASIIKAFEASRAKSQPRVASLILAVIAATGSFFLAIVLHKHLSNLKH